MTGYSAFPDHNTYSISFATLTVYQKHCRLRSRFLTVMRLPRACFNTAGVLGGARMMSSTASSSAIFSTPEALPLDPPSLEKESADFKARCDKLSEFFSLPRFKGIKRPYSAVDVASKQGSLPVLPLPSTFTADKLYTLLSRAAEEGKPVHTMGAIDPVQMSQMVMNQEIVYVSGWACSSVLTTGNNEVGPDFG